MDTKRITIIDIARKLGIAKSTVSMALRNNPRISEERRAEIHRAAVEMGYVPDPMLSALAHYSRSHSVAPISAALAWVNCWPNPKKLRTYREFDLYWQGAADEASRCGFRLEEFLVNQEYSPTRVERILVSRGIRGILIPPHGTFTLDWGQFNWGLFSAVRFGHSVIHPRVHLVTSDQMTDGLIAFENIWKQGYRRIGLACAPRSATRFSAGYLFSQMRLSPGTRIPPLVFPDGHTEKLRCEMLKAWAAKHKLDAIVTDVPDLRNALLQIGYRVPADIGLAAFSVLDGCADAGIDQNSREIGKAAVQLLISLINHNERGVPEICREVLIEGHWVNGKTLPSRG
jgi:DNA-binding LacI/PurR family transcriptional regulator